MRGKFCLTKMVFTVPQPSAMTHKFSLWPSLEMCTLLLTEALNGRVQGDCIAHIFTVNRVTAAGPDCTAASLCCVCARSLG